MRDPLDLIYREGAKHAKKREGKSRQWATGIPLILN
jgi:hypothetical protein